MLATCRKLIERRRNIGANWMKKRSAHLNMAMAAVFTAQAFASHAGSVPFLIH
jgi:hypothetical protein